MAGWSEHRDKTYTPFLRVVLGPKRPTGSVSHTGALSKLASYIVCHCCNSDVPQTESESERADVNVPPFSEELHTLLHTANLSTGRTVQQPLDVSVGQQAVPVVGPDPMCLHMYGYNIGDVHAPTSKTRKELVDDVHTHCCPGPHQRHAPNTPYKANTRHGSVEVQQEYTDLQAACPAPGADRPLDVVAASCFRANEVAPRLAADAMMCEGCARNPRTPTVAARTKTANKGNVAIELQSFMA